MSTLHIEAWVDPDLNALQVKALLKASFDADYRARSTHVRNLAQHVYVVRGER